MNIALCKCGTDMSIHDGVMTWEDDIPEGGHAFDASGTKHRCEALIQTAGGVYLCPRPAYHRQEGIDCGPLTGEKLW